MRRRLLSLPAVAVLAAALAPATAQAARGEAERLREAAWKLA